MRKIYFFYFLASWLLCAGLAVNSLAEEPGTVPDEEISAATTEAPVATTPEAAVEAAPETAVEAAPEPAVEAVPNVPARTIPPAPAAASGEMPEMLLFEEIPIATITKIQKDYTPASMTVITAEQIRMTSARNIYDLIEAYVPGSFWVNHHESPHFGIRGIISDRNYKFILLVNGRKINQDSHSGAELLLENWDLNDIQKIEIVRGPGSVTYGPGAIEGVINITTKNAGSQPGTHAGVQYVYPYDSKGMYISQAVQEKDWDLHAYGSVVRTSGIIPDQFYVTNANLTGYLGEDEDFEDYRSLYYFNDAGSIPQVKFNLEANYLQEWNLFALYSNSGTSRPLGPQTLTLDGDQLNLKENSDQGALVMLRNQQAVMEDLELKSMLSYSSLDHQRRSYAVSGGGSLDDPNSIRNLNHKFSESEFLGSVIGNYTLAELYQFALGVEYSQKWFGPGWNGNFSNFRMGDSSNIFGSEEAVVAAGYTGSYFVAEQGWKAYKYSVLAEANLAFDPKLNLVVSGRMDDHEMADANYSPRVVLISDWQSAGIFKLIGQQSVRMNTEEQILLSYKTKAPNALEKLTGVEFNHKINLLPELEMKTAVYHNTLDIVGWRTVSVVSADFSFGESTLLGRLRLWGIDWEALYTLEQLTLGLSQTYCKQVDFTLAEGQRSSGISYADYNLEVGGTTLSDTGNDLNNWANLSTKLFADYKLAPEHTLHLNLRALWGMEGADDGLDMLAAAAEGTAVEEDLLRAIDEVRKRDAYQMDLRLDAAYRYDVMANLGITLYGTNLLNINGNKRYAYDAGIARLAPYRTNWIDEPLAVGVKAEYSF